MKTEQFLPPQASTFARDVDSLYWFLWAITIVSTVGVCVAIYVLVKKYLRKSADEVGEGAHEGKWFEIGMAAVPFVVCMVIFFWGAIDFMKLKRTPKDALEVSVVGKRWMWKIQHADGRREINELHVPKGRPVSVRLISQDVIHSFFIPAFRVKQDAIPNFYTSLWFEATQTGTFHLLCAEYCGKDHSVMVGKVIVMEPEDYAKWLNAGNNSFYNPKLAAPLSTLPAKALGGNSEPAATTGTAVQEEGKRLFTELTCVTCHQATSTPIAPTLHGVFGHKQKLMDGRTVTVDENYIRESLLNPTAKVVEGYAPSMPAFAGRVSEEQILSLIAYIKTLRSEP